MPRLALAAFDLILRGVEPFTGNLVFPYPVAPLLDFSLGFTAFSLGGSVA